MSGGRRRAHGQEGGARGLTSLYRLTATGRLRSPSRRRRRAEVSTAGGRAQRDSPCPGRRSGARRWRSNRQPRGRAGHAVQSGGGSAWHAAVTPAWGDCSRSTGAPSLRSARPRGPVPLAPPGPGAGSTPRAARPLGSGRGVRAGNRSGSRRGLGRGRLGASLGFEAGAGSRSEISEGAGVSQIRAGSRKRPVGRSSPAGPRGCGGGWCWKRLPVSGGHGRAGTIHFLVPGTNPPEARRFLLFKVGS